MSPLHVVVLAAGKGTRMKSLRPKVLHEVAGRPMIDHVLRTAQALHPRTTTIVVGHMKELLQQASRDMPVSRSSRRSRSLAPAMHFCRQPRCSRGKPGPFCCYPATYRCCAATLLSELVRQHAQTGAAATILTALFAQPYGYGRIVRARGRVSRIVEERDASPGERAIKEINSGIYVFAIAPLFDALRGLAAVNAQGEYYLTDLASIYRRRKLGVERWWSAIRTKSAASTAGLNWPKRAES